MGDVIFEFPMLILHGDTTAGQPNFDAELDPDVRDARTNADLTILMRVCLQRNDPAGGRGTMRDSDNTSVPIRSWTDGEWQDWTRRYARECRNFWNGKFWLPTPDTFRGLDFAQGSARYRCNVYCRFDVQTTSVAEGAHAVIPVVRVQGRHFFRSNSLLYSNRDILPDHYSQARSNFFTHLHEVGHLLGLAHPGEGSAPGCVAGDEMVCYAADPDSVMGLGSDIRVVHARPWIRAIALITGTSEASWTASRYRIYPRRM